MSMIKTPDIDQIIAQISPAFPARTLTAPFNYLQSLPSNNDKVRSKFLTGFNERFFHISDGGVIGEITTIVETFHAASLLIDDIEDDSTLRRGKPCAHLKYGIPSTLNSGNLMYFVAIQRAFSSLPEYYKKKTSDEFALAAMRNQLSDIFHDEMVNLHVGQGLDIYWRDNLQEIMKTGLPTIEEYLQVAMHKTGGLFRLAVRTLSLFAGGEFEPGTESSRELIKLANLLGVIYQIRDDYMNLVSERYAEMKGFSGEDLIEGKLSLPILYTLLQTEKDSMLHRLYAELTTPNERRANMERLDQVRLFISRSGALEFSYSLLQEYVEKATIVIESSDEKSFKTLSHLLKKLAQVNKP
ncbi:hypothetical protein JCM33374_g4124 [Metschnikowia sp. JCM 33374]|nr:hypothetical protein JCM33374_g4124 [Metschnikowia sp. JCM 33374]